MKYTYEEITTEAPAWSYIERSDGAVIPKDPANSDYQAYLAAQSTPIVTEDE
jgi:hypothetical protein